MAERRMFLLVNTGAGGVMLQMLDQENGMMTHPATSDDFYKAMVFGVACLNTGLSDSAMLKHISLVTPADDTPSPSVN